MKTCLFLLFVVVFCEHFQSAQTTKGGLYSATDDVTILTEDNFYHEFLDKDNAWIVEFYNSWCGHCINFAPTWKKFAKFIKGWESVLRVGAVDCSNTNNSVLCRTFNVHGYPTMLYFSPHASKNSSEKTAAKVESGAHEFNWLVSTSMRFLDNLSKSAPASWPRLSPLRTIEEIWPEAKEEHKYFFLIFELSTNLMGRTVILDTMNIQNILVRRMLSEDVSKFGISHFPSLYSVNRNGIYNKVFEGNGSNWDRANFVRAIWRHSGYDGTALMAGAGNSEEQHTSDDKQQHTSHLAVQKDVDTTLVYMRDMESALRYCLTQEVAIKSTMDKDMITALKNFITTLTKYFPGSSEVMTFLVRVKEWLQGVSAPMTGDVWAQQLEKLQDERAYLPLDIQWVGCAGSRLSYRGYPCAMWTLFHTLTVSSYRSHHRTNPQEVLLAVRGYMKHFFGCRECSENFYKMAATLEDEVRTGKDTVLWLWQAHNKANKRLHGELSEDPLHLKIQFPSEKSCHACRKPDGIQPGWNKDAVLAYLVALYGKRHILKGDNSMTTGKKMVRKVGELDWWEQQQRAQDLKKIRDLRLHKRLLNEPLDEPRKGRNVHGPKLRLSARDTHVNYDYPNKGWGINSVDLGMCMMFYVTCAVIILLMYYHLMIRKNWRLCPCL